MSKDCWRTSARRWQQPVTLGKSRPAGSTFHQRPWRLQQSEISRVLPARLADLARQVRAVDGRLEQLLLSRLEAASGPDISVSAQQQPPAAPKSIARAKELYSTVRSLSFGSRARPHSQSRARLLEALRAVDSAGESASSAGESDDDGLASIGDLQWFLLAKVANHAYGHTLQALIDETLPLNDGMWYWTEVLDSQTFTALYSAQTAPLRFWHWSSGVYAEVRGQGISVADGWHQFYRHVQSVVRARSLGHLKRRMTSPMALVTEEVRSKITSLRRAKTVNATAIGYLLSHCFDDER